LQVRQAQILITIRVAAVRVLRVRMHFSWQLSAPELDSAAACEPQPRGYQGERAALITMEQRAGCLAAGGVGRPVDPALTVKLLGMQFQGVPAAFQEHSPSPCMFDVQFEIQAGAYGHHVLAKSSLIMMWRSTLCGMQLCKQVPAQAVTDHTTHSLLTTITHYDRSLGACTITAVDN
jgi:hypothetical protein